MKIDINKKYRTRNGREVTHLHRVPDGFPTPYPWRGLARDIEESWTEEGVYDIAPDRSDSSMDLIEVREPRELEYTHYSNASNAWKVTKGDGLRDGETIRVREIID